MSLTIAQVHLCCSIMRISVTAPLPPNEHANAVSCAQYRSMSHSQQLGQLNLKHAVYGTVRMYA